MASPSKRLGCRQEKVPVTGVGLIRWYFIPNTLLQYNTASINNKMCPVRYLHFSAAVNLRGWLVGLVDAQAHAPLSPFSLLSSFHLLNALPNLATTTAWMTSTRKLFGPPRPLKSYLSPPAMTPRPVSVLCVGRISSSTLRTHRVS